jgi:hypothetical protein
VRRRVLAARERQTSRTVRARVNANLTGTDLKRVAPLDQGGRRLLERSAERLHLSARAFTASFEWHVPSPTSRRRCRHNEHSAKRCNIDLSRKRA